MKRSHGLLIALAIVVVGLGAMLALLTWYVPRYIEQRVAAEARARGVELVAGDVSFGWQWLQVSNAKIALIGAPSIRAQVALIDVELAGFQPQRIELSGVDARVTGTLPRVLLELGEWTKRNPSAYDLPLVASRLELRVAETPGALPWLAVSRGFLTRTVAGAAFSAESCKLSGFELGRVGAGFSKQGSAVKLGFGDQSAQAAPLTLEASWGNAGGSLNTVLAPTKLGLLSAGLGVPLPFPEVVVSGDTTLGFATAALDSEAAGKSHFELKGWIPPHPPELSGFVFGDVTTIDSDLKLSSDRNRVTLSNTKLKAGKFELAGSGTIVRENLDLAADIELEGALPCDALAGAAAESRLGQLLGRVSARQGRRTAQAVVGGTVTVVIEVHARLSKLADARLVRRIGVGCGLKPLTLAELLELTPNAEDLAGIGDEVGKKLEDFGRNLGLPPVPSALKFPKLPLPNLLDPPAGTTGKQKDRPAPRPSR
jgi:hypothetical protein